MKQYSTKKLFFAEYLYKLTFRNELNNIFSTRYHDNKNLSHARQELDRLTGDYRNGKTLKKSAWRSQVPISTSDYQDAMKIYAALKQSHGHRLRIDYSTITIFSNDKEMLVGLADKLVAATEFYQPDDDNIDFLLNTANVIIVEKSPKFAFKVTFSYKAIDTSFADWLENNTDKSSVGPRALDNIRNGYPHCVYIYVRDERVLTIVQLLVGSNIQKVERLVTRDDIDKYMYGSKQ